MKFKRSDKPKNKNMIALKGGTYSLIMTLIILVILVVVNVFVNILPSTVTKYDISATQLYSITSNTKAVVNKLTKDVNIYWIVQSDQENQVIDMLLSKYESLSDHIHVEKKNPDVYPTFTEKYTDEDVANNSIIVECGDSSKYIPYSDIYVQEADYTTYSYKTSFDGEGTITSAINYVTSDTHPKIYTLEGHGEADLPTTFSSQIERENYETESISLLNEDSIPDDASAILIYSPSTDISDEEKNILSEYLNNGGKIMVCAGTTENGTLTNLYSLLSDYGITTQDGIVIEGDREYYAFQQPFILMPTLGDSSITEPLTSENYYVLMPISQGLNVGETDNATVTQILTTSDSAFNKEDGVNISTYDKEDGDKEGPFTLGVDIETNTGGEMIWYSSSYFLDDTYKSYSSGANINLAMNSLSKLIGNTDILAIRSKSLSYNYLTISSSDAAMIQAVMIAVIPAAFIAVGIVIIVRRRLRNAKV